MNKKYESEKEYSFWEIARYNLKMWWMAAILGIVFAAVLGAHQYKASYNDLDEVRYGNISQVRTDLYVNLYSDESAVERVNTVVKIAASKKVYRQLVENTGYDLTFEDYQTMYGAVIGEPSNVVSLYISYPVNYGNFSVSDEAAAKNFANELVTALEQVTQEVIGQKAVAVVDAPYVVTEIEKINGESISQGELQKRVMMKCVTGFALGVLVEIILYTIWMLIDKKPKNAEEIRQCIGAPIIDVFNRDTDNEEAYQKAAVFVSGHAEGSGTKYINCMNLQCTKKEAAYKLAMSYAAQQKKTLLIDLASGVIGSEEAYSVSGYVLGKKDIPAPLELSPYLDAVCRNKEEENGFNIAANERFKAYLTAKSEEYEYIVIGSSDLTQCAEGYILAGLCEKNILMCERKNITNKELYQVKNTIEVNEIQIDGVIVYE